MAIGHFTFYFFLACVTLVAHPSATREVRGTSFCSLAEQAVVTSSCHRGFCFTASLWSHQDLRFAAIKYQNVWLLSSSTVYTARKPALQFGVHISCRSLHTAANTVENAGNDTINFKVTRQGLRSKAPWCLGASISCRGVSWPLCIGTGWDGCLGTVVRRVCPGASLRKPPGSCEL